MKVVSWEEKSRIPLLPDQWRSQWPSLVPGSPPVEPPLNRVSASQWPAEASAGADAGAGWRPAETYRTSGTRTKGHGVHCRSAPVRLQTTNQWDGTISVGPRSAGLHQNRQKPQRISLKDQQEMRDSRTNKQLSPTVHASWHRGVLATPSRRYRMWPERTHAGGTIVASR